VDVIPFSLDKRGPFGLGWKHHPGLKVDANYYWFGALLYSRLVVPTGTKRGQISQLFWATSMKPI
jgi:hypothetical protein